MAAHDAQDSELDAADYLEEMDAESDAGPIHSTVETSADLINAGKLPEPKKKPTQKRKKKAGEGERDEEEEPSIGGSASCILDLESLDPQMANVAKKHEQITGRNVPPCLFQLAMPKVFENGGKIGQAGNGVPRLAAASSKQLINDISLAVAGVAVSQNQEGMPLVNVTVLQELEKRNPVKAISES